MSKHSLKSILSEETSIISYSTNLESKGNGSPLQSNRFYTCPTIANSIEPIEKHSKKRKEIDIKQIIQPEDENFLKEIGILMQNVSLSIQEIEIKFKESQNHYENHLIELSSYKSKEHILIERINYIQREIRRMKRRHTDKLYQRRMRKLRKLQKYQNHEEKQDISISSTCSKLINESTVVTATKEEEMWTQCLENSIKTLQKLKRKFQSRVNQRNSRQRQKNQEKFLLDSIKHLREEENLSLNEQEQIQKNVLVIYGQHEEYRIKLLKQYVDMFQYGFNKQNSFIYQQQLNFLHSNMKSNLNIANEIGVDALINQWDMNCWMTDFMDVRITNIVSCVPDATMIRCETGLKMIITHRMIATLYPHMVSNLDFIQRVVGKCMYVKSIYFFTWENEKIQSMSFEVDFLNAWFDILEGDMPTATKILNQAKLTDTGYVVCDELVDYYPQERIEEGIDLTYEYY